ncbi:Ionotropic glutamate receptor L-glutamate and glycine-binding domain [Trinorchestia longiramus]|nr:Ionotropic glutamate receptor L-glutamate and glycine-binding domain [Trinorchestia longiramus]
MTPSQLAQVVCALAAAGASKHIQLVTLTGEPTHERALALQLLRSCHGVARVWQPLPVEGNASSASLADLIRRRYKREMTDVLFVAYIFSVTDVALLNKPELLELTSLSRLLLFVQSNFLSSSLREFHGQINNKVIFIEARASSMSAWEAFRTEPSEMAKPRYLSLVSSPPLQEQLDVLRRKPWYRRTNLTGLTLRCSLKNYVPFTVLKKLPGGLVSVSGLLGDVIDALATYLQMRIECREPKDKKWGAIRTPDGNWVGVLGDVVHGRADIALPYYYPMVERQTVFDFSHPIGDDW